MTLTPENPKAGKQMRALGATHTAEHRDNPVLRYYMLKSAAGIWCDVGYTFGENHRRIVVHDTPRPWPVETLSHYKLEPIA